MPASLSLCYTNEVVFLYKRARLLTNLRSEQLLNEDRRSLKRNWTSAVVYTCLTLINTATGKHSIRSSKLRKLNSSLKQKKLSILFSSSNFEWRTFILSGRDCVRVCICMPVQPAAEDE